MAGCGDDSSTRPPSVQGAVVTTPEDTPVTHTLVVEDVEGAGFRVQISAPMHGIATVDGARVTYTPAENYNGPDAVLVTVIANEHQATATLDFTVTPVNDVPVAVDDSLATDEDVALVTPHTTLLANDTDVDGDTLTITQVGNAVNGTVATAGTQITFTPTQDFVGDASYEYTVSDGTATATATVRIAVGGVNDPPVAVDDAVTTAEDTPIDIPTSLLLANDTDPEGQTLTVVSVSNTTNGTVALDGNVVRYQPSLNFNGNMTFEYTVSDGSLTDVGRVTVTVTPVNDAPVAVDDAVTTPEDTAVVITNLTANDTDVDGPALSVTAVANATHGTVSLSGGAVTFTPALNFNGNATVEYPVTDGSRPDDGLVTVTVTPVNDAPVAVDDIAVTPEDTDLVLANLAANDVDVDLDPLTVVAVGSAVNGTVVLTAGVATFTPAPNFNGTASFQYTVSDGSLTDVGLVTITVTPVNDAPVAGPDTATVQAGGTLVIPHATLLANDTDIDGPALSITAVQNATHGTVSLQATTVTFVAEAEFDGTATFEYIVSDGTATAVGLVAVTVVSGPICGDGLVEGAETCDDGNVGTGDGCSATCQVETGWMCSGEPS
ncbi:MAG: tandem-95 repeat protein, partial [Kofleriaceae bacterium]